MAEAQLDVKPTRRSLVVEPLHWVELHNSLLDTVLMDPAYH